MKTDSFECDGPYCVECGQCIPCTANVGCSQSANGDHMAASLDDLAIVSAEVSEG